MPSDIRVRFAPSPTGYLHIGGARTALFNWLFVRHHGGKLVLRIEDTDIKRNTEEAAAAIYEGLEWLGLSWDEGPNVGGKFGPYFQSKRTEIYGRYLKKLQDDGHIFEDQGALRFRSPREHVVVNDLVCGKIDFDLTNPGTHPDMTIRRPDGSWIFHFVNVIDDIEMKISHVIRGEDHLSNTPKHIELYRALGATPPHFAHIPLILNRDGSKMSKRDAGARVATYIEQGYTPEAVRNYLCLLGWSPKDNREKIDIGNAGPIESTLKALVQKLDCKTGDLVHPARVAVSGRSVGPSLYHMLEVMGKARVLTRFGRATEKFSKLPGVSS